jgi:hypothetical protein
MVLGFDESKVTIAYGYRQFIDTPEPTMLIVPHKRWKGILHPTKQVLALIDDVVRCLAKSDDQLRELKGVGKDSDWVTV